MLGLFSRHRIPVFIVALMSGFLILGGPGVAGASPLQKGASVYSKSPGDYGSTNFKKSIDSLVATGATDVALLYSLYQPNVSSSRLVAGWNTPTDQALVAGIDYAHSVGLDVMLSAKAYNDDGVWHADIDPADRNSWFSSYEGWLLKLANLAQQHNVAQLSIGTEMYKVASHNYNADNTWRWESMIAKVRSVYSGSVVYGTQHSGGRSELLELGFGDQLDILGVSAYFPLTASGNTPEEQLRNSWQKYEPRIESAQELYSRPIAFTEAGYRSVVDAHIDPYSYWREAEVDLQEQVRSYDSLFSFWTPKPYYAGTYIWAWEVDPNAGGENDTSFTPQNKPAQATLCSWYMHDGAAECESMTTHQAPDSTTVDNDTDSVGVDIPESPAEQDSVDVPEFTVGVGGEDYQGPTSPVHKLPTHEPKAQDSSSENVDSSSSAKSTQEIKIWWPNKDSIRGNQPIRALIDGAAIDSYDLYWQVNGGELHKMVNDNTPSVHKEGLAETWRWQEGVHSLRLVAKKFDGSFIADKTQTITTIR